MADGSPSKFEFTVDLEGPHGKATVVESAWSDETLAGFIGILDLIAHARLFRVSPKRFVWIATIGGGEPLNFQAKRAPRKTLAEAGLGPGSVIKVLAEEG